MTTCDTCHFARWQQGSIYGRCACPLPVVLVKPRLMNIRKGRQIECPAHLVVCPEPKQRDLFEVKP